MLKDGSYAAWFKTPMGQGTGIAHLADGKIWGRDSIMLYSGSCEIDGDRFTADLVAQRHTEGRLSVFGSDGDLRLKLTGTCGDGIATYVGTSDQFPGVLLEGTLIFNQQQQPDRSRANEPPPPFDPSRLPQLPRRSR
jgi:hypothetical protein